ncbi:MAG: DsrE family protein [Methylobacter sp.]|uniref:DsrE family protein n=1 Tax=Methylobacter sp. TaxID=2051955 RepID=UPI002585E696|nr:DsrE family protein [Methylobacter sp.]MCL7422028.1 DsrE family protein [Methylobacter sp.]
MFALSNMPTECLKIVLVVHGPATPIVLKNDACRQRHQTDNPNTELIQILMRSGVDLFIRSRP